jgi:long-chain acyl-CoA synthetase
MLHDQLTERASKRPDAIFIIQGQRRVTYGEINQKIFQMASFLLGNGLRKGDRVAILCENSPEYVASYFAIQKAGGISVDINFQYSAHEIIGILNHCSASVLIVEAKYWRGVADIIMKTPSVKTVVGVDSRNKGLSSFEAMNKMLPSGVQGIPFEHLAGIDNGKNVFPSVAGADIASIVYTSGTTGEPKGVMLTHDNFLSNARSIIDYLHLSESDRVMVVLPFCYSYGKSLLTTHVMAGGALVLENSFMYPNVVFDRIVQEGATGLAGVPSTFAIMLNKSNIRNYRFPNLRYVTQAGGAMPPQHARALSAALPNVRIYIMYGQTEATARLTYLDPGELHSRPGSIGKPIPGVEIELVNDRSMPAGVGEEGEIVVRGQNVMAGYWNNPANTEEVLRDGKLYTGDLAKRDKDGYLYIVARRSDMIKSGAHRISPKEIEEVILELDEVHEVSVVGIHDDILGETIRAVVVLKDGRELDAKKVQRHCQTMLATFKIPKDVVFSGELPKTTSGKVRRYLLKDHSATGLSLS